MKKILWAIPLWGLSLSWGYDDVSLVWTAMLKKNAADPTGVVLTEDGRVFVADGSGKIVMFGPNGAWMADWGKEKNAERLKAPRDMAVGPSGDLYVADADRVIVFSSEGKRRWSFGTKGSHPGELSGPAGMTVAADGSVVVADSGNKRVQTFSREGVLLDVWSLPDTKAGAPAAVALLSSGRLALWGEEETQVRLFQGNVSAGEMPLPVRPTALAVARDGGVFVGDGVTGRVVELNAEGKEVNGFGSLGTGPGQFRSITALSAAGGKLAVLDEKAGRVQVFRVGPDRKDLLPSPAGRLTVAPAGEIPMAADSLAVQGKRVWALSGKKLFVHGWTDPPKTSQEVKGDPVWAGPRSVAVHPEGLLVVEEGKDHVSLRSAEGKILSIYGVDAKGKGRLSGASAVTADGQGRVYVSDLSGGRVLGYARDGIPLFSVSVGKPLGLAGLPRGVAVVSGQRKTLMVLDERGKTLWETAPLQDPVAVTADGSLGRSLLYVLEAGAPRVSVWAEKRCLGQFGSAAGMARSHAIAADDQGEVWVADDKTIKGFRVAIRPAAPENLTAKGNDGAIELSWSLDGEGRASSYRVTRSTSTSFEGNTDPLVVSSAAALWRDEEIVPGLTYYYTLTAAGPSPSGETLWSAPARASAWTARPAHLPPVDVSALKIDSVFSADYKRYADDPIGQVEIKNNTEETFRDVKIGFTVVDFMDFQTEQTVNRLTPGSRQVFPLKAVFNNKILSVSEDTPVQGQVSLTYYNNGTPQTVTRHEPFRLYSRNAMDWDHPARLATFITPKDTPVLEFGRSLMGALKSEMASVPLPSALARAVAIHAVLGAQGLTYLKDPNNPFQKARQANVIDYVQFPRETLKRKAGDCDDLVALYASLLESLSVPTRIADLPGHVLVLARLDDPRAESFSEDRVLRLDDGVWVPLETTWVGKSFEEAWREGARALRKVEGVPNTIFIQEAWGDHPPATLSEEATLPLVLDSGGTARVKDELAQAFGVYLDNAAAPLLAAVEKNPKDTAALLDLGLFYADNERWTDSADAFDRLLAVDPENAAAINNRANLYLLSGEIAKARALYMKAAQADPQDEGVQLNLVRAAKRAGDKTSAQAAFRRALEIAPALKSTYARWEEVGE